MILYGNDLQNSGQILNSNERAHVFTHRTVFWASSYCPFDITETSNMYPTIKFKAKNWSDLCNFYSKVIFLDLLSKKIIFTFLC